MNNILTKTKNKIKGLHKSHFIKPHAHWEILIKFFLTISMLLILISFYFLYKIKNEDIFQVHIVAVEKKPEIININFLNKINKSFKDKRTKNIELNKIDVLFKDPSFN